MKIETFNYKGKEIKLPIIEKDEIEKYEMEDDDEEKTEDITELVKGIKNEQ